MAKRGKHNDIEEAARKVGGALGAFVRIVESKIAGISKKPASKKPVRKAAVKKSVEGEAPKPVKPRKPRVKKTI